MKEYFFNQIGDARMETQNSGNWTALTNHLWATVDRGDSLPNRALDIIDIGCHTGGLLALLDKERVRSDAGVSRSHQDGRVRSLAGVQPLDGPRQRAEDRLPKAKFYADITDVPSGSVDVVLSHEMLYLIGHDALGIWMDDLRRILRPEGGAFISLGSHAENTAWMRWRPRLEELYGHVSEAHDPMYILREGQLAGFDMELHRLHPEPVTSRRYSSPEDGWGEFVSAEEMLGFQQKKLVFVCYPNR